VVEAKDTVENGTIE